MSGVTAGALSAFLMVLLFAPRRWALLAVMGGVFFLTQGHYVEIGGLSITPLRFLEIAGFTRVLLRRELIGWRPNVLDSLLLVAYTYSAMVWSLRSHTFGFFQLASAIDPVLCYLTFRGLLRDIADLRWFLRGFLLLLLPFTALVLIERTTGQSPFVVVGASAAIYFRDGVARCQGTFRHAILMGSVAASFLALYAGLGLGRWRRPEALFGAVLCAALVIMSNSGGPLTSLLAAMLGVVVWPLRHRMSAIRRVVAGSVLFLIVFMKAPIWYLPFKISEIVGGGGYHRGLLMEQAWNNMGRWWLVGMENQDTASWFPYVLSAVEGADVTNEFVMFGLRAGLLALLLMIALLTKAFGRLGEAMKQVRLRASSDSADEGTLWGLGVALFVHVVSWLGVGYFDQSYVIWILDISAISACAGDALGARQPAANRVRSVAFVPGHATQRVQWGPGGAAQTWFRNPGPQITKANFPLDEQR